MAVNSLFIFYLLIMHHRVFGSPVGEPDTIRYAQQLYKNAGILNQVHAGCAQCPSLTLYLPADKNCHRVFSFSKQVFIINSIQTSCFHVEAGIL